MCQSGRRASCPAYRAGSLRAFGSATSSWSSPCSPSFSAAHPMTLANTSPSWTLYGGIAGVFPCRIGPSLPSLCFKSRSTFPSSACLSPGQLVCRSSSLPWASCLAAFWSSCLCVGELEQVRLLVETGCQHFLVERQAGVTGEYQLSPVAQPLLQGCWLSQHLLNPPSVALLPAPVVLLLPVVSSEHKRIL